MTAAGSDFGAGPDSLTLRRRLVFIDFERVAPPDGAAEAGAAGAAALSGVLRLNLFEDASFTGLVETVAPTFIGRLLAVGAALLPRTFRSPMTPGSSKCAQERQRGYRRYRR